MHFETDHGEFLEAKVNKNIQGSGEDKGADGIKPGVILPMVSRVGAEYILSRLGIDETDIPYDRMFHGVDGHVRRFGIDSCKMSREYLKYKMTIAFSPLNPESNAQTFLADKIKVTKLIPLDDHLFDVEFTVELQPYSAKDVGWLVQDGIQFGTKACFLQFEQVQTEITDKAA